MRSNVQDLDNICLDCMDFIQGTNVVDCSKCVVKKF